MKKKKLKLKKEVVRKLTKSELGKAGGGMAAAAALCGTKDTCNPQTCDQGTICANWTCYC